MTGYQLDYATGKPRLLKKPDLNKLRAECALYLREVSAVESDDRLADIKEYIFEAAFCALYGDDIFDWINSEGDRP